MEFLGGRQLWRFSIVYYIISLCQPDQWFIIVFLIPMDLIRDVDQTNLEGVDVFVKRMKKTFRLAMQMVQQAQQRQKCQADQRRCDQRFHSGEQVLLSTEHLQLKNAPVHKLKRQFVGPFAMVRLVGPVAYKLEPPKGWKIHNVFHTSLL